MDRCPRCRSRSLLYFYDRDGCYILCTVCDHLIDHHPKRGSVEEEVTK
jgi:hypothetical protein